MPVRNYAARVGQEHIDVIYHVDNKEVDYATFYDESRNDRHLKAVEWLMHRECPDETIREIMETSIKTRRLVARDVSGENETNVR